MINLRLNDDEMRLLIESVGRDKERVNKEAHRQRNPQLISVYQHQWDQLLQLLTKLHEQNIDDGEDR